MRIRRVEARDRDALVDVWLRSVRATHTFLSEADIQFYLPLVREVLQGDVLELWVLSTEADTPAGFLGLDGGKIEALFLAPEYRGMGWGRRLVEHARALRVELTLDVNEENDAARRFYEACGFVVEGRSDVDATGRPHPLLHMRRPAGA
jgi:putative acetyltransferase